MTSTTLSFAPGRSADAFIGTKRVDHWFTDDRKTARKPQPVASAALPPTGLRAFWAAHRARRARLRADALMYAVAGQDERVLRELQVARDLAEWKHLSA